MAKKKAPAKAEKKNKSIHDKLNDAYEKMKKTDGPCQ
jgi:hypothetical protein